jgi:opacity protein-like surface antigen
MSTTWKLSFLLVVFALAFAGRPSTAAAQHGPELGVRTGYAFAAGHTGALANSNDQKLGDWISGQVPIWIDAGYRFNPLFYLGLYAQYGFGFVNDDQQTGCRNSNVDCSASDTRFGIMGRFHFAPAWQLSPWVGAGFGYEWAHLSSTASSTLGSAKVELKGSGFEIANLQVGLDWAVASHVVLAPFLSLSFGQYRYLLVSDSIGGISLTGDGSPAKESIHEWILLGVRAAFLP